MMYQWFTINTTSGSVGTHSQSTSPFNSSNTFDPNLIPSGCSIVGPYDDTNPMPSSYQPVWNNPQAYLYQNGAFVDNPNWQTTELQIAKANQKSLIESGLTATLVGGFKSNTTGHTYVTTTNGQTNMEGDLKRFDLDSSLTSVQFFTIDAGWISHTHQDLINAFLDGGKWKDAQYSQQTTLNNQIDAATTVSAVQAITWTPATY